MDALLATCLTIAFLQSSSSDNLKSILLDIFGHLMMDFLLGREAAYFCILEIQLYPPDQLLMLGKTIQSAYLS